MTVTLELEPDILEAARREAEAQGVKEAEVLTNALHRRFKATRPLPEQKPMSEEELKSILAEMHEIMKDAPVPPPDAFTRDSISHD